jgi:drug/metabolite transporter (DMT)-like permease
LNPAPPGFIIYAIGNIGDFVALAFAAQSLVAPLGEIFFLLLLLLLLLTQYFLTYSFKSILVHPGSVVLVVNAIMSPWILKEKITGRDIQAIMLIIVGDVLIVLYASHEETSWCLLIFESQLI